MAKAFAQAFYSSAAWKSCREAYKRKMHYLCERCLKRGILRAGTIVHHKIRVTPETLSKPEVLLSFDNLELLCAACHRAEHEDEIRRGYKKKHEDDRYYVDENGNVFSK